MITNLGILVVLMQFVSVNGQVRDTKTHEPLALVRITLLHQGVPSALDYTDSEGRFHFANVNPGSYTISVVSPGYDTKEVELESTMGRLLDIDLTRTVEHAPQVSPVVSVREYMIPEAARKEFDRARKDIQRQDCEKAIGHLESGLRLVDHASALNDLGNCYRKLGQLENAETSFKRALELSDSVYIALNLADLYTMQKRFNEAETVLRMAITRTPGNGDAYYGLAVAYFKEDRVAEAEAIAVQADTRPHRIVDLHLLLAKIYARTNPDRVAGQLELYLKEAPNGSESGRVRQVLKAGSAK